MKYQINISFESDKLLTEDEFDGLVTACYAQIEDPADHTRESKRARFSTSNVVVS
jgi:hypothetical protein